jgi:asparagine synthase (glutamine-hydrolysing)
MCGICGYLNLSGAPADAALAGRMARAIAHRGPDGEGQWADGPLALGHRRLAILDLSAAGAQPMLSADGRLAIAYNGEVYNFRELRRELEALGHSFRSRSDTEVVLAAYSQWGADCVRRFNGMFALALWDARRRELFLARDRYGIKPLYYAFLDGALVFGSEQKAILAHPAARRELDLEALLEYFTFQNIFTDRTLLKGVRLFPAAHTALVRAGDAPGALGLRRYWDFDFREPERPAAEAEYVEELDRLFRQAVKRQLVSDVEVNAYLSGGMDSGAITAIAAQEIPYIKTFTCGFDLTSASGLELTFDEREKSEQLSYLLKTEHYEVVLKAGDMERCLPRLAWHLEEPRVGQSYQNFLVAGLASKFGKVVLAGTGGDEMFAGYPWRYYRAVANDSFDDYIGKYYGFWQRLLSEEQSRAVFAPTWSQVGHVNTRDIFRNVFARRDERLTRPEDYVNHSLTFEAKTFLSGLLIVEDKISMAHGLETRVPFLDNDLVDFAQHVPVPLKLGNLAEVVRIDENEPGKQRKYFQRTRDGKLILRKAMERYVPRAVTEREKQGFSAPDASWFKGESIEYVRRVICDDKALLYDYLDRDTVRALVEEHLEGRANKRLLIWSLLNVEQWLGNTLHARSPVTHEQP